MKDMKDIIKKQELIERLIIHLQELVYISKGHISESKEEQSDEWVFLTNL